jgi:hypothetical protein
MRTSIEITTPEPQTGAGRPAFSLSGFLSASVSKETCFCCGSPTDLMLGDCGRLFLRCPVCGAELEEEETIRGQRGKLVLQAA